MLRKILILLLLIPIVGFSESSEKPITIGLIHFSAPLSNDMDFSPSLKHLQKVFAPRKVIAKVYSSADLENAVKEGKIDFFYASSGFFYRMLRFGARDIATVVTNEKPEPNFGTAGAFITRRDRTDIKTLEDMRGKTFAANYESAFHGYRIGIAELVKHGYDPKKFFRRRILSESQRINCWTKLFRAGRKLPSSGPAGLKNTSTKTLQCSTKSKL